MKQSTFKILFYLRSNHINKDGTSAIIVRVSIDILNQVETAAKSRESIRIYRSQ